MLIIHFDADAPAISDFYVKDTVSKLLLDTHLNSEVDRDFYTSNLAVIQWLRAELLTTYSHLQNKVKWFCGDVEIHFDKSMRTHDWKYLYDVQEEALLIFLR